MVLFVGGILGYLTSMSLPGLTPVQRLNGCLWSCLGTGALNAILIGIDDAIALFKGRDG